MGEYSPAQHSPSCFLTQRGPCLRAPTGRDHSHQASPLQSCDNRKGQQTWPNVPTGRGREPPPVLRTP